MRNNDYADIDIFVYYLNLITISIPPTLPLALLAGLRISNNRFNTLKNHSLNLIFY